MEETYNRYINQVWKMIPMAEESKDWRKHLSNILIELDGLKKVIEINDFQNYIILMSKLHGLLAPSVTFDFQIFKKNVFKCISILEKMKKNEIQQL